MWPEVLFDTRAWWLALVDVTICKVVSEIYDTQCSDGDR